VKIRLGPLIALLLLTGLGAWVYFQEFRGAEERRRAEDMESRVLPFERDDLKWIIIANDRGELRIEKQGDEYRIVEPLAAATDQEAIDSLLSSLELARIERRIGVEADMTPFGLDAPRAILTVDLLSSDEARSLHLGDDTPIGRTLYALLPRSGEVAIVSGSLDGLATTDLFRLRDKSLISLDPWKVTRLRIERSGETVLLERPESGWRLLSPVEAPADGPVITDLLSAVDRLRTASFAAEEPTPADLERYGLDPPGVRLAMQQEGWDAERTILFGGDIEGDRYARAGGRDPVLQVPGDIWDKLQARIFDLRRKDLLSVSQYRIETLTASREGAPAVVLRRGEGRSWIVSGRATGTVTEETVDVLLRVLGTARAVAFIDAPDEELRTALAARPALDLILGEEKDTDDETTVSQHLLFGPADRSGRVLVRDMDWRPIAITDAATLQGIQQHLEAIVEAAAAPATEAIGETPEEEGVLPADPSESQD
jgi:hypothetical protein